MNQLPGLDIINFVVTITLATIIGICGLLAGLKGISLLIPKWDIRDTFKDKTVTNSGIIIAVYIFALAMVISYAIY
jgi:hypothetical protein